MPIDWNKVQVKLAFKHENKDKKNYRPVAVANTISNIFCGIIKDKLTAIIEEVELISKEQNGFRKKTEEGQKIIIY